MKTIHEIKSREVTETPLLLFACELSSGGTERWCTHKVIHGSDVYQARVLGHDQFEIRAGSDDGIDAVSRASVVLANADSHFSQLARSLKGARLTVSFVFFDAAQQVVLTEPVVVFRGTCNPPDEITESHARLSFTNRMNMQRLLLPDVRVQRRCPWAFPSNAAQRAEALSGDAYGRFHRCGYSPDQGGCGSGLFTTCDYTRAACVERGMFDKDSGGRETRRFGGIEYVPSTISVKTYGEKAAHLSGAVENESKYNDFVPVVYGTAWYRPPIVFARNDGNLTRMEVLLGMGEIERVLKVIVNGNELPVGNKAAHATATGWYNVLSHGTRNGAFNPDFFDSSGQPKGDPYGSMAVMSVVVPNRISDGSPLPKIDVLVEGLKLPVFGSDGMETGRTFTNNPAWIVLDLLRRCGWGLEDIDVASFFTTAAYCDEEIQTADLHGNEVQVPRFQCNFVLRRRRSAADVIRGVRNGSGLYLTYGSGGRLELHAESSIAMQQPEKAPGSNSLDAVNGGWPVYEFGDGSNGFSDIARREDGRPSFRVWSRSTAESPNRFSVEFQDQFNEYQQDSLSLVDVEDAASGGHEVNGSLTALGLPNFNQAARMIRLQLDKSIRGNVYVDFETGLRSFGVKPGDLITITYLKEGFERQLFRVVRVRPGLNHRSTAITAQIHDDAWYDAGNGELGMIGGGRLPSIEPGVPRPLLGTENGGLDFGITESPVEQTDGSYDLNLRVEFATPSRPGEGGPGIPLLSLSPRIETTGGTLAGANDLYYAISGVDANGQEGPMSFIVRAALPPGTDSNCVTLEGISFGAGTARFHVYRGENPAQLMRVAADQQLTASWTDNGAHASIAAPPDPHYHHANFYWRPELMPEQDCDIASDLTCGNTAARMIANEYRGKLVRITAGAGRAQERLVASNDATTLTLTKPWTVIPDATSSFVVAESSWTFGALTDSSPAVFNVFNRSKSVVHVCGRAANVNDRECAIELSPVTRYTLGGAGLDIDVPDAPVFGLGWAGRGGVELTGVGFKDLDNTRSVAGGTLSLHYWDELTTETPGRLLRAVDASTTTIELQMARPFTVGQLVQIGVEIVAVRSIVNYGQMLEVDRGAGGSTASVHPAGTQVSGLTRRSFVVPFVRGFFGTPASGSYAHWIDIPCVRIVAAEFFVTNGKGNSQVANACYAGFADGGIRTLSGGQYTLQVDGPLAIQSSAVPPLIMDADRSVFDVFADVAEAPTGNRILVRVNYFDEPYCELEIPPGQTHASSVDGLDLPPLYEGSPLGLEILEVGTETPGSGLTVTIRV